MTQKQQDLLIRALADAANAILITDAAGGIVWVNRAFCGLSGYAEDELLGNTPALLRSGVQNSQFYKVLWKTILSGQPWQGELVERHKNGRLYTIHQIITPLLDNNDQISHFIAIQHDITAQQVEHERIHDLAYRDSLTGLANRRHFLEQLHQAIGKATRRGHQLAVMFLDLDRFKEVNDTQGHAVGDQLLSSVAERLSGAVRKTDVVARLGGDEFTILIKDISSPAAAEAVARQLVETIDQPFSFGERQIITHASVGISLYPRDGRSAEALLKNADAAMYRVKAAGGKGYGYLNPAA